MNKPAPDLTLFVPDDDAEMHALAEAEAQVKAGRLVSHDAVRRWLMSWGKPDELPAPQCGE